MARQIDIEQQRQEAIDAACAVLGRGLPVAIPTETVYGLAADATNADAIARIYTTKGRPRFNPLICHMADLAMAERFGFFDATSRRLAEHFWPGPLTIVVRLKESSAIHPLATAGLATVGMRVPQGFSRDLIQAFGRPLAAPSANRSGKISPTSAAHVETDLGDMIELILDGGASAVGVESTIVKAEAEGMRLLRPGGIAAADIERVAGCPLIRMSEHAATAVEAPGMLASHYAPDAAMRLNADEVRPGEVLIDFGNRDIAGRDQAFAVFDLSPSRDLSQAAARLFDYMKKADASGASVIAVAPIPEEGLGEAINDRLRRAAAPRDQ